MRDSIGGTVLFMIVLFLFSMFIIFMAFIIKYARVYKVKNSIVNYIERNEGVTSQSAFDNELLRIGYSRDGQYKLCRYLLNDNGGFFYIELFSRTTFPVIGDAVSINISIKGETRMIETGTRIRNTAPGGAGTNIWFTSPKNECQLCTVGGSCETVEVPDLGY